MRPIKFRAWDKIEKQWAKAVGIVFLRLDGTIFENEFQGFIDPSDRYALMQYTGLKDKNGKEIYEGDILDGHGFGPMIVQFGEWDNEKPYEDRQFGIGFYVRCPLFRNEVMALNYIGIDKENPVIGNIYENPELLKENKA